MGIKVKGVKGVVRNVNRIIDDIQGRKIVRALQSAMLIGGARAALYTPIDTSALINSQFREVITNGAIVTGRVGYSTNYAVYVHDPANPQQFRRTTAKKEFLTLGFEEERSAIDAAVAKELSL
ncbi:HK97 gp10 family phage protein [Enterobacter roggenkampii]|uniref:HK97 gp10 family phage protein n=1 Tax=Enterobacter TaxID=547 RepID=UPI0015F3D035|nr:MULTISPECIES: HK97 gp10 family phage protein [Enterobacter]MBA7770610.1 HK97 gp10 family phage protein [Enterobacter sp. RHBSTW-00974]MBA7775978.1 HK97 gp10 family phage protein [Enterobacter sp. RHBSTW-00318]MBA7829435.1 HK97 gp10 family phage protein [Enterobacter sp. RHBSTW-00340]MBA8037236.1 HK97 gp10 family phage protein [Enterobacter sp. RHBSTW-00131]WGG66693.1 HK97 gp10 family phage protein [Enterobacter ludwigii]